jgi:GntR family transcriptional regulator, arabinose operon transcriptional repressor
MPTTQSQITQELRRRIVTGRYGGGHRLPPERELQEEFGVSRLTVAKALSPLVDDGLLSRTRGRGTFVLDQAQQGPQRAGQPRRGGAAVARGNVIKYISPGHSRSFPSMRDDVLFGLHGVLDPAGYHVSVDFYSDLDEHLQCLLKSQDPQIAGIVLWPLPHEKTVEAVKKLREQAVPLVLIDTFLPEIDCDYVVTDNIAGAAMMVHRLAGLGHQRISYVGVDERRTSLVDRLSGFFRGMVETGLPIDDRSVLRVGSDALVAQSSGALAEAVDGLLGGPNPPTAIFASHDYLAILIMGLLRERGVSVPTDLTVVGYDGIEAGEFCVPALTTIQQDFAQTARTAARILLERFDGRSNGLRFRNTIDPTLVIRQSSAVRANGDLDTSV